MLQSNKLTFELCKGLLWDNFMNLKLFYLDKEKYQILQENYGKTDMVRINFEIE